MAANGQAASSSSRRRKTHNKSRNGCTQCKKRHYKCDELYPTCSHCKRLGSDCSLSGSASPADSEVVERQLNIDDLRLLHDWQLGSDTKFSDHNAEESFRQGRGREIELGFQHPYVLHIILAIAALHLTSVNPTESKWYALAISHHGAAIRLARPHIAAASSAHSEAVFNFSCFNSLFAFAEPALRSLSSESPTPRDYIGDLVDSFRMSRGIRAIITKDRSLLAEKGAINNPAWSYKHLDIESNIHNRFPQIQALQTLVDEHLENQTQRSAIRKDIHELFVARGTLDETPPDHSSASLIQRWAIGSDKAFLELCDERHPLALVIIAHYAVLVKKRANIWFFRRWPELLLQEIGEALRGSRWEQYIEGPRREIEAAAEDSPTGNSDSGKV